MFTDIFLSTERPGTTPVSDTRLSPPAARFSSAHSCQPATEKAAAILACTLLECQSLLEPGIELSLLAKQIRGYLEDAGSDRGSVILLSPESVAWHGKGDTGHLYDGQVLSVDLACSVAGWWADSAWTFPVGTIDERRKRLLTGSWEATRAVAASLCAGENGRRSSDLVREIGTRYDLTLIPEAAGHGIGRELHQSPPLSYTGDTHQPIAAGKTYTVEPVFTTGNGKISIDGEGVARTLDGEPSAHFELTLFVDGPGSQILGPSNWFDRKPC